MSGYYATAVKDVSSGLAAWRIWTMLASNDIKQRYRRSTLGQFWLTLSMAIMIFSMGAVYSILFNIEIKTFIPYLAVSLVMWGFISSAINGCDLFLYRHEQIHNLLSRTGAAFSIESIGRDFFVTLEPARSAT